MQNGAAMVPPRFWTAVAMMAAVFFYVLALAHAVYDITSPYWLSWHVVLRKFYSIVAFAIVGYCFRRAFLESGMTSALALRCIVATALYSASIEVGQFVRGSQEGLGWNAFDTVCGAAGGALGVVDVIVNRARARTSGVAER